MPTFLNKKQILEKMVWKNIISEYSYAGIAVFYDDCPVVEEHMIVAPLQNDEKFIHYCFSRALNIGNKKVMNGEWESFNIGYNEGRAAGRTINWPHVHLIPRRTGDVKNPSGGVRCVISKKQHYKRSKHH